MNPLARRLFASHLTSRAIFDAYRDAGGNFVDTADIYSGGGSETLVGRFIAESKARDEIVLATKFAFNGSDSPLTESFPKQFGNPDPLRPGSALDGLGHLDIAAG